MRVNQNFVLRKIRDAYIIVPLGEAIKKANGIMVLNETGAYIFEVLQEEKGFEELVSCIMREYEVPLEITKSDASDFLEELKTFGILMEEE